MTRSSRWLVAIAALWIGWPHMACMCANGGFKIFCDAHSFDGHTERSGRVEKQDCCHRQAPADDRSQPEQQIERKGCTPLAGSPVIASASALKSVDLASHGVVFHLPAIEPGTAGLSHPANLNTVRDTGPPLDILAEFHRLQI